VICVLSPERIVLGGGVMSAPGLLPLVRREVGTLMNGYLDNAAVRDGIGEYVTLPRLGPLSGVLGGIGLARDGSSA
jgi:fructokinase